GGGMDTARSHAPVLARLRPRLPAPRQLHPSSHTAHASRSLRAGRRFRPKARVLGRLGFLDPAFVRDRVSTSPGRDLRVSDLRRFRRSRGRGRSRLREDSERDLRSLRRAAQSPGDGASNGPNARSDRLLGGTGRDLPGRAAVPAREPPPASRALEEGIVGARRRAPPAARAGDRAEPAAGGKRDRTRAGRRALRGERALWLAARRDARGDRPAQLSPEPDLLLPYLE